MATCRVCGKEVPKGRRRYCSQECYDKRALLYYHIDRQKALDLIGDTCLFCDSKQVRFHEIRGNMHPIDSSWNRLKYYLKHPEDFVPLCVEHHQLVHRVAELKDKKKLYSLVEALK